MPNLLIYIYMAIILAVNVVIALLPINREASGIVQTGSVWEIPANTLTNSVNLDELLSSGFWGDASAFSAPEASAELGSDEAQALRSKIKAIIDRNNIKQVLFAGKKGYVRVAEGEALPDTTWILVAVGGDWLKLSKTPAGDKSELLKLFVNSAPFADKVKTARSNKKQKPADQQKQDQPSPNRRKPTPGLKRSTPTK